MAQVVRSDAEEKTGHRKLSGAIVHEVEHIPDERQKVLAWIGEVGDLKLKTLRECALGGRVGSRRYPFLAALVVEALAGPGDGGGD